MTTPNHLILHTGIAALAVIAAIFLGTIPTANAAFGDGASSNIRLLDTNANGKIDRITFNVANPSGETWRLVGAFPHGLSVVDAGNGITVSSISFTTAVTANPVGVQADLNESDPDLTVDTSLGAAELVYNAGPADNISDGVDEQVNAILSGDTNATDTETDFAAPVLRTDSGNAPRYEDNDANGRIDRVRLVFSETTTITYADANWTATANTLSGFDVSAVSSGNGSTTIYLTATANAALTGVSGGTEPTLAFSHATNITDGTNPLTSISATSLVDAAAPVVTAAVTLDIGNDGSTPNGKLDHLRLEFSEAIDDSAISTYAAGADYTPSTFALAVVDDEAIDASEGVCPNDAAEDDKYLCVIFTEDAGLCDSTSKTGCDTDEVDQDITWTGVSATIRDAIGNTHGNVVSGTVTEEDGAGPFLRYAITADLDDNGRINQISAYFSEIIDTSVTGTDFTVSGYTVTSAIRVTPLDVATITLTELSGSYDTGATPTIAIANSGADIIDPSGNPAPSAMSQAAVDGAAPILVSASPTDGGVLIPATANFTMTFSEAMETSPSASTDITGSANSGTTTFTLVTSGNTITANPTGASFSPGLTVTITLHGATSELQDANGVGFNSFGLVLGTFVDADDATFSFTTQNPSSGGGGGGGSPSTVPVVADAVTVTSPNGGEALTGGALHTVAWTSAGNVNNVNLSYSLDSGATFVSIVSGTANDGSYIWSVPNIAASSVLLRVVGRDAGGATLASDLSNATFSITQNAAVPVSSPVSSSSPVSMRTGSGALVEMATGVLFRGVTLPDVYRVNADGTRHVFPNEATFFSWGYSFDQVVVVNDDQLRLLSLGARVTMKPGSYLVKIQSNPKVYEVGEGATLTHVPDEATAAARFGVNWATMVRDIPVVFFGDYITS